jgi:hypothetical protein
MGTGLIAQFSYIDLKDLRSDRYERPSYSGRKRFIMIRFGKLTVENIQLIESVGQRIQTTGK